jgi:AcrR family transcriptional regulator
MNSVVRPTERTYLPVEERRAEIVEAAIELISREGLAAASTRQIAAEAGVSLSTLHYCFGTKEALIDAVIEAIVAQIGDVAGAALPEDAGLAAAIDASVRAFWGLVENTPGLQTMQYELTLSALRGNRELAHAQYEEYVGVAEQIFRRAAKNSGERPAVPARDLARFVVAGLDGLILQHLSDPDVRRSRRQVRHLVRAAVQLAGISDHRRRTVHG